jgi:hypothetical protein
MRKQRGALCQVFTEPCSTDSKQERQLLSPKEDVKMKSAKVKTAI